MTSLTRFPSLDDLKTLVDEGIIVLVQVPWAKMSVIAASAVAVLAVGRVVYNIYLHPLRHVPGPILWRATPLPMVWHATRGDLHLAMHRLHEKYGRVIRTRPDELSFCTSQAWKDIYNLRTKAATITPTGAPRPHELPRDLRFYKPRFTDPDGIITAPFERHNQIRAALSGGFSDRSMQAQEPTLLRFIDTLIEKLHEQVTTDEADKISVDLAKWFNCTTFDIISELVFGESFQCLENDEYHGLPAMFYSSKTWLARILAVRLLGLPTAMLMFAFAANRGLAVLRQKIEVALKHRLTMGPERDHDFIAGLAKEQRNGVTFPFGEIKITASSLVFAGSETTATLLSAVTNLLLTNPETMAKVTAEVRGAFASDSDINIISVNKLKYMLACLREALRCYPPAPGGLPRLVPAGGDYVDGVAVPGGTTISVSQYAASHSSANWTDPFEFRPERFLGEEKYANDDVDSMQPFSLGPRNCIGKNLAYTEMRLILAKVLYNFDLELASDSRDWFKGQKSFTVWQKPAMNVYLRPAGSTQ